MEQPSTATQKKWERNRINATLIDISGKIYHGQLFSVNDSSILFLNSKNSFQSITHSDSVYEFKNNQIQQLNIYRKNQILHSLKNSTIVGAGGILALGFLTEESAWGRGFNLLGSTIWILPTSTLTGFLIGLNKKIDVEYRQSDLTYHFADLKHNLKNYAIYPNEIPHSAMLRMNNSTELLDAFNLSTPQKPHKQNHKSPFYISRFHLYSALGLSFPIQKSLLTQQLETDGFENSWTGVYRETTYLNIGIAYRFADNFRLGIEYSPRTYFELSDRRKHLHSEHYAVSSIYYGMQSWSMNLFYTINPYSLNSKSNFEFTLGAGISTNYLDINQSLSIAIINNDSFASYATQRYEEDIAKTGFTIQAQIDYYLTRNFSFNVKTGAHLLSSIELPDIKVHSQYLNEGYTLRSLQISPSVINTSIGIHFHF